MVMTLVGGITRAAGPWSALAKLWAEWLLLGDSVSIQWVPLPSPSEQADSHACQGAKEVKHTVTAHKSATDIWADLGCKKCRTLMTQTRMRRGAHVCLQTVNHLQTGLRIKDRKFLISILNLSAHETFGISPVCLTNLRQHLELMVGGERMPVTWGETLAEYPALHSLGGNYFVPLIGYAVSVLVHSACDWAKGAELQVTWDAD